MPQFADESNADFHLSAGSPLLGAGLPVANISWGSSTGAVDLGAFGMNVSTVSPWPNDAAMERARARDYEAALRGLRAKPNLPNSAALESWCARRTRCGRGDGAGADGSPAKTDLMARFERVRRGKRKQRLRPLRRRRTALEMADLTCSGVDARCNGTARAQKRERRTGSRRCVVFYYRSSAATG